MEKLFTYSNAYNVSIYVQEEYRGQGYGDRLFSHLIKNYGKALLIAITREDNEPMIGMLRKSKYGFFQTNLHPKAPFLVGEGDIQKKTLRMFCRVSLWQDNILIYKLLDDISAAINDL